MSLSGCSDSDTHCLDCRSQEMGFLISLLAAIITAVGNLEVMSVCLSTDEYTEGYELRVTTYSSARALSQAFNSFKFLEPYVL